MFHTCCSDWVYIDSIISVFFIKVPHSNMKESVKCIVLAFVFDQSKEVGPKVLVAECSFRMVLLVKLVIRVSFSLLQVN